MGLTRTMAVEARGTAIRVNAVAPAAVTRMVDAHFALIAGAVVTDEMRRSMPADLVAPVVGYLCHSSCELSGEVLQAGGGRVSRIVFAETVGVTVADLTLELVADHIARIVDDQVTVTLPDTMNRPAALATTT